MARPASAALCGAARRAPARPRQEAPFALAPRRRAASAAAGAEAPAGAAGGAAARFLARVAPPLDGRSHKGQGGRIAILGGSADFTGAPYYAGMAALRTGAELVYVLTAQEAALPLKAYSPELMVTPVYSGGGSASAVSGAVERVLPRLHALVVGPGLGRQPQVLRGAARAVERAAAAGVPVVVDADGMQAVIEHPNCVQAGGVLLTPNAAEYRRLLEAAGMGTAMAPQGEKLERQLMALCSELGGGSRRHELTICLKGPTDLVATPRAVAACSELGTPRRSGGFGDLLAGAAGTILAWLRIGGSEGGEAADAALAACTLVRRSSRAAFVRRKRAMTAPDVLEEIGDVFEDLCPTPLDP